MAVTFHAKKAGGALWATLDEDKEILKSVPQGQFCRVTLHRQSKRSEIHHRLYWGGLIKLALDYWSPGRGCISKAERAMVGAYNQFLSKRAGVPMEALEAATKEFMTRVADKRAESITPIADADAVHLWIKDELNLFDVVPTPSGYEKRYHSTSFQKMDQSEFNLFYKAAFGVVWNLVLSTHFESEEEAHNVINELVSMG